MVAPKVPEQDLEIARAQFDQATRIRKVDMAGDIAPSTAGAGRGMAARGLPSLGERMQSGLASLADAPAPPPAGPRRGGTRAEIPQPFGAGDPQVSLQPNMEPGASVLDRRRDPNQTFSDDIAQRAALRASGNPEGRANMARLAPPDTEAAISESARRTMAKDSPHLAAMQSGLAGGMSGLINAPAVAADYLNQLVVNPVARTLGAEGFARAPNMPGADYFAKAAAEYMPKQAQAGMGKAWDDGKFIPWLTMNMAAQAPQMAQQVVAAMVPPLRAVILPGMGATQAGQAYQQGDASSAAISKGLIEAGTEMLPLQVFDKVKEVILRLPPAARGTAVAEAMKRLAAGGAAITAGSLTEALEEGVSQVGQNLIDIYQSGKQKSVMDGVPDAMVLAGAMGGAMGVPNAATAMRDNSPGRQVADAIQERAKAYEQFFKPAPEAIAPTAVRADSIKRFDEFAAATGLNPKAVEAVRKAASEQPADAAPGYLRRVADALARRGMFKRAPTPQEIEALGMPPVNPEAKPAAAAPEPESTEPATEGDFTGLDTASAQPAVDTSAQPVESAAPAEQVPAPVAGPKINRNWTAFAPESGTLAIPREQMPQISAEHRGALVQFLKSRGIQHSTEEVGADTLKPTQAEFSPKKVQTATDYTGGNRSILVSSDGYILDGTHQWLAQRDAGGPVKAIRLDAPIQDLLRLAHQFPSSTTAAGPRKAADVSQPDVAATAGVPAGAADGRSDPGVGSGLPVGSAADDAGRVGRPAGDPAPGSGTAAAVGNGGARDQALKDLQAGISDLGTVLPPKPAVGQTFDMDGKKWRVVAAADTAVSIADEKGNKRMIAKLGETWPRMIEALRKAAPAAPAPNAAAPVSTQAPAPTQPKTLKERREAARQDKGAAAGVVTWQRKPPRDGLPGSLVHRFTTTEGMDGQVLISPPGWRKGVKSFVVSFDRTGGPLDEKGRTKFYPTVDIGKYKTEEAARIAAEKVIAENRKATNAPAVNPPQAPPGEAPTPRAGAAAAAPAAVPGARAGGAVEAAGVAPASDQQVPPKRTEARRTAKHPQTVMGSRLLAQVSISLDGLHPSLLSEFSERFETARKDRYGRPMMQWRNPMIPGVGLLFRRSGTTDRSRIAQTLEDYGYLPPGTFERDYKEAGEQAKDLIRAALNREEVKTQDEIEADAIADQEAERQAYYAEVDAESAAELEAERAAIMAGDNLTTQELDALTDEDLFDGQGTTDTEASMRAMGFTEQEIADELAKEAAAGAAKAGAQEDRQDEARGARPAAEDRGAAARPAGQEGLTLARGATELLAREPLTIPVTRAQSASPYAEHATGEYIVTVQQFSGGPGVIVYAVKTYRSGQQTATLTAEIPTAALESREFGKIEEAARALWERVSRAQESDLLTTQTPEDLKAKADREEAATKAAASKKSAEQERLRKEAEARDNKARADATVDDFQLGQDATRQMSGMGDMFADEPAAAPAAAPVDSSPARDFNRARQLQQMEPSDPISEPDRELLGRVVDAQRAEVRAALEGGATFESIPLGFAQDGDLVIISKGGLRIASIAGRRSRENVLKALQETPAAPATGPTPNYAAGDRITPDKDVIEGDVVRYRGAEWMAKVKRGIGIPLFPMVDGKPQVSADTKKMVDVKANEVIHTGTNVYGYGGQPKPAEKPAAPAGDLAGRANYRDGRSVPIEGDEVYTFAGGFAGMPASVQGVVRSGKNGLYVAITGSRGMLGETTSQKRADLTKDWTLKGEEHPNAIQRRESDAKIKADSERRKAEYEADREAAAARNGTLDPKTAKLGDVLEMADGELVIVSEISERDGMLYVTSVDRDGKYAGGSVGVDYRGIKLRPDVKLKTDGSHQIRENGVNKALFEDGWQPATWNDEAEKFEREAPAPADEAPQFTEAQARKQFEWRDLGQKDGTKTHGLFFYLNPEDKGTGRAMGRGQVTRYEGSNGWQVDSEGQKYPALADAKKAAIDAAIPVLREQGWISPAAAPTRPTGTKIEAGDSEEVKKAKADLMAGLGDLASLLAKPGRTNITPEEEQRLLPILTKVFDAAFRLGYLKFKDAAKFVLDQIRGALGDDAADAITLDHLQGSYIGMSGRYKDQGASTKKEVVSVEDIAEIQNYVPPAAAPDAPALPEGWTEASPGGMATGKDPRTGGIVDTEIASGQWFAIPNDDAIGPLSGFATRADAFAGLARAAAKRADNAGKEAADVPDTSTDLERDRADPTDQDAAMGGDLFGPGPGASTGAASGRTGSSRSGRPNRQGVPPGRATPAGELGDQPVHRVDGADKPAEFDARDRDGERSDDPGIEGVQPEAEPADEVEESAVKGLDDAAKRQAQRAADRTPVVPGDLANIRATLPYLLEGQQEDVHKAEIRFAQPDGYGMLFTNGTGTGKTFSGLGIAKRFERQGKTEQLFVVPDEKIMSDWVESARALGLTLTPLANTKDAGKGLTITTYANLGQNDALAARKWDLVTADEAHMLMQAADAKDSLALDALRALTLHPRGAYTRAVMLHRPLLDEATRLSEEARLARTSDDEREWARATKLEADASKAWRAWEAKTDEVKQDVAARQGAQRPRLSALSATPFAYVPTVDWAEGYLFDYSEGQEGQDLASGSGAGHAYNSGNWREKFFMQHFGYRMRYNKLTQPDAKVDTGLMERQFNSWLKKRGVLSSRILDVPADYDRRFVLVESAVGNAIDRALEWIGEQSKATREANKGKPDAANGFGYLQDEINDVLYGKTGHLTRRYLLEAIKAKEVIPHIREHLAMGRKVVVFHDFNKGGSGNPFAFGARPLVPRSEMAAEVTAADYESYVAKNTARNAAIAAFEKEFPELVGDLMSRLISPIARFTQEFPNVLLINGLQKKSELLARYKTFNDDTVGPIVALVQSDKNKGWSGHDTTGKHQRVLFNLGLPTQPTKSIQQEGRIYRTGQVSNAMFRYLNTGTNWERWAFAQTIASRASTAENLAAGELARALKDAYISGYEESGDYRAGHEGEGTGGKARDRLANEAISEYDRAKSYYWGTQKKDQRTKAQEGKDYFATPEPVGFKMVEWADARGGEDALEPSGGHGAIARWFSEKVNRTAIEPSSALGSRMALVFDGKIVQGTFEDHHIANKYDTVAMNPPYGTAGRTAIDHVAKAATHLREGGRIVALIPDGPSANQKFDKWFYEADTRQLKPAFEHPTFGPVYRGDTIDTALDKDMSVVVAPEAGGNLRVEAKSPSGAIFTRYIRVEQISAVRKTGKRIETYKPGEGLHLVAEIKLPSVTFERAGTGVRTRIVVIDKLGKDDTALPQRNIDLSDIEDINELFDRLEGIELSKRTKEEMPEIPEIEKKGPVTVEELQSLADVARGKAKTAMQEAAKALEAKNYTDAYLQVEAALRGWDFVPFKTQTAKLLPRIDQTARAALKAKNSATAADGEQAATEAGLKPFDYLTSKGKTLRVVHATHLTKDQAADIEGSAWRGMGAKPATGYYIKLRNVPAMLEKYPPPAREGGQPNVAMFSRAPQTESPDAWLYRFWNSRTWDSEADARDMMRRRIVEDNERYAGMFKPNDPALVDGLVFVKAPTPKSGYNKGKPQVKLKQPKAPPAPFARIGEPVDSEGSDRPRVDWESRDMADDGTPESVLQAYGRGHGNVYRAWVNPGDIPAPKGGGIKDGYPDMQGDYDWSELQGRGSPPPLKLRVGKNGKLVLMDGNHRLAWWREQGVSEVPAYVIDERPQAMDVPFSRATATPRGLSLDEARAVVGVAREANPSAPLMIVMRHPRDLNESRDGDLYAKIVSRGAVNDVEAAYHEGSIYVFADHMRSRQRAMFVIAHHEIRHHGMRSLEGKRLAAVLDSMVASNQKLRDAAQAKIDDDVAEDMIEGAEEALADMDVAEVQALKGWPKVLAAVRQWLRGFAQRLRAKGHTTLADVIDPKDWTDADVAGFVARAEAVSKGGRAKFGTDGTVFNRVDNPTWYSELARQVEKSAMNAAPATAWKQMLKGLAQRGVKPDEIEWSGLNEWLDLQQGKVTKKQIAEYLDASGVRVTETVLGDRPDALPDGWSVVEGNEEWEVLGIEDKWIVEDENRNYKGGGATRQNAINRALQKLGPTDTKYANYTLPGGTNYREVLLTLPTDESKYPKRRRAQLWENGELTAQGPVESAERWRTQFPRAEVRIVDLPDKQAAERAGNLYRSGHWDQPNVLAHIRLNDRTDASGARVLFVEEVQSDWGQEGKKRGFNRKATPQEVAREVYGQDFAAMDPAMQDGVMAEVEARNEGMGGAAGNGGGLVPTAPFVGKTDAWVALALKRVIKMAVDGGYDKVAFVTGEQSADRYDLSKQISTVRLHTYDKGGALKNAIFNAIQISDGRAVNRTINSEQDLVDVIGKDVAEKLLAAAPKKAAQGWTREVSGLDLKVGGEGMRAFYDKIVPTVAKDVLRKLGGGAMETVTVGRESVYPREFQSEAKATEWAEANLGDHDYTVRGHSEGEGTFIVYDEFTKKEVSGLVGSPQPGFTITDTMKAKALGGMPMFSRAPRVTQDTHDGAPVFASDDITLAFPQDTERFEVIPQRGERVVNYAIMPAQGFDVLGHVELLIRDGKPVSLLDIEVTPAGRRAGTGRKVIETLLAANPDADLNISNIVQDARGFWERMGVPQQNLEQGAAYDGTLNWETYAQAQVANGPRAAAAQGREAGARSDARAEGTGRGAAGEAQGGLTGGGTAFSRAPKRPPKQAEALRKAGVGGPRTAREKIRAHFATAMQMIRDRNEVAQQLRQGMLDQFAGIQRAVQRDIGSLPVEQDPYVAARLANGGTSAVMRALMLHGQAQWAANGQHLEKKPGTKGLLQILEPIGEDVNDWFGWMIGNRAARLMAEGRENNFTADDIKELQALATPANKAKFQKAAVEYTAFKRSVLDVAQAAGLINAEARKVWDHADYIPFYRQIDDSAVFGATGKKGLAGQSSGIRALKGGEAALNDPMENLLMNFSRLIDASLKNNAISRTVRVLEDAGSSAVAKVGYDMKGAIVPTQQVRKLLAENGTPAPVMDAIPEEVFEGVAKMWALQAPTDPAVVRVMRDGKPQFYRVDDPLLLQALTSFVPFDFPGLGMMRAAKRLLTATVTATPEFMARNFIRDSVAAQAIGRSGFNPAKSLAGIVKSYRETGGFEAMLFAGASFQSGNVNAGNPEATGVAMRRALRAKGFDASSVGAFMGTVLDTPARFWDRYREIGEAIENANREAVYEATMSQVEIVNGQPVDMRTRAAYEAKDIMDFNLRGSWAAYQLLADVLPFFNARVQGLYRMGRSDPKRLATVGMMLMTASLMLAMANDGEDWYEELPDWDKDTYWHFKISSQHFRVPKPFEIGLIFATIPERLGRSIKGLDSGKKTVSRLWAGVRDTLAFDPVPQLGRPVLNVWANKDTFRDSPIETLSDEGKLPHLRYSARTSDTMRALADVAAPISDATGLSPKRMEYLIGGYFGTIGLYALAVSDAVVRELEGKPPGPTLRMDDLPLVRSFYRMDPARATVFESDLYDMREDVEAIYRSIRSSMRDNPEEAKRLLEEEKAKIAVRGIVVGAARQMAALNRERDMIYADRTMDPDEKRRRVDALQQQKNAIAKAAATDKRVKEAF